MSALDIQRKDKPTVNYQQQALLSVIGGNIAAAISFAVSRERHASKMAQRQRGLSGAPNQPIADRSPVNRASAIILLLILLDRNANERSSIKIQRNSTPLWRQDERNIGCRFPDRGSGSGTAGPVAPDQTISANQDYWVTYVGSGSAGPHHPAR
jgi:hypothetical protein